MNKREAEEARRRLQLWEENERKANAMRSHISTMSVWTKLRPDVVITKITVDGGPVIKMENIVKKSEFARLMLPILSEVLAELEKKIEEI